jgi:hypothetical protein
MDQFSEATALIPHTTGAYRHFFGGPPKMAEPDPFSVEGPAHLLYDIDLADPLIPSLPLKGIERLLLVYPFRYEGAALNYQITPNGSIAGILRSKNHEPTIGWPYHGYPVSFPRIPVSMQTIADGTTIKAEPTMPPLIFGDFLARPNGSGRGVTIDTIPNLSAVVEAEGTCQSAACIERQSGAQTRLIAAIPNNPVPGLSLWGELEAYVWVIYEVCPDCGTITTYNICD